MKIGHRNTAAPSNLFQVNDKEYLLYEARQEEYHTITVKTLWICQRSRPDIQLAIAYHCTRVNKATDTDWAKLKHLMQFIWTWRLLPLIIKMNRNGEMMIYIDGAHIIHMDTRGYFGLFATMGK